MQYEYEDLLIGWLDFWLLGSTSLKCFPFLVIPAKRVVCHESLCVLQEWIWISHCGFSQNYPLSLQELTDLYLKWLRLVSLVVSRIMSILLNPGRSILSHLFHFPLEIKFYFVICKSILLFNIVISMTSFNCSNRPQINNIFPWRFFMLS